MRRNGDAIVRYSSIESIESAMDSNIGRWVQDNPYVPAVVWASECNVSRLSKRRINEISESNKAPNAVIESAGIPAGRQANGGKGVLHKVSAVLAHADLGECRLEKKLPARRGRNVDLFQHGLILRRGDLGHLRDRQILHLAGWGERFSLRRRGADQCSEND